MKCKRWAERGERTGGFVWVSGGIRGAQKCNRIAVWPPGRTKVYFSEAGWYGVVVFFSHVYLLWCRCGLIGKVLPSEYSWQREEGNGIGSEPNKERKFGGRVLDHWFGDPSGGEKLLESELTETSWERSVTGRVPKIKMVEEVQLLPLWSRLKSSAIQ